MRYHSEPVPQTGVGISRMNGIAARKQKEGRAASRPPVSFPMERNGPPVYKLCFPRKKPKIGNIGERPYEMHR